MALRKENEIAKLLLRLIRGISTGEDLQREASLSGGGDRSLGGGGGHRGHAECIDHALRPCASQSALRQTLPPCARSSGSATLCTLR